MLIASVNQDRGIDPDRAKGAAVHLRAMRRALGEAGAEVLALDEPDGAALRRRLERVHAERGLALVYERYALGGAVAGRFAREFGLPHVLEVNAPLLEEAARHRDGRLDAERVRAERDTLRGADVLLAVSQGVRDWLLGEGVAPDRVRVRPNAVDSRAFHPGLRRPRAPDAPLVLGFHGRLRPWHGFERLVRVVAALRERGLDVVLETLGSGPFAEAVEGALPAGAWRHTGWVDHDDVPGHVARFDVLALTYPPDAPCYFSPLKLLEAMAVGVVPVVPDLGDLATVVAHEREGLVYDPADLDGLVDLLAGLAADPERRRALARGAARRGARQTWRGLADEVLAVARGAREAGRT